MTPRCPVCRSRDVLRMSVADLPPAVRQAFGCDLATCRVCRAIWEAFPVERVEDPVCADPCDNCAFRPGSPEQADREGWQRLIAQLRPGGDLFSDGRFYCHKNVPVDMTKGPGNFLFPQKPVTMDGQAMRNPDGSPVLTFDLARMRVCSGYLRMVWAHNRKKRAE